MILAGTLGSRALGEAKPSLTREDSSRVIGGFENTNDPAVVLAGFDKSHLSLEHPWHHIARNEMRAALDRLVGLSDEEIEAAVAAAHYSNPEDSRVMIQILINRRNALISYLREQIR